MNSPHPRRKVVEARIGWGMRYFLKLECGHTTYAYGRRNNARNGDFSERPPKSTLCIECPRKDIARATADGKRGEAI